MHGACASAPCCLLRAASTDEGLRKLHKVLGELPQARFSRTMPGCRQTLAEALGGVGEISRGHATIDMR